MPALYRKYRPQTFEEVVGQEAVVRTLSNAIEGGKIRQAYLFAGPRGTGKTSLARILAKSVNCKAGPTAPLDCAAYRSTLRSRFEPRPRTRKPLMRRRCVSRAARAWLAPSSH